MELSAGCPKLVLWNSHARCASQSQTLRDTIAADPTVEIIDTTSAEDCGERARQAAAEGAPLLVAAGGDGTIHTVLQGLVNEANGTALGILPLGTGNDLCRALRLPLDPWAAWEVILAGRTQRCDMTRGVTCGDQTRCFSNVANGGNSSRLLECLTDEIKQAWGTWAYLRSAVHVLTDLKSIRMRLSLDDQPAEEFNAWNVVLANGNTAGAGIQIAPRASLTDGLLDVIVILDGTGFDLAEMATGLVTGDYLEHERVVYRHAKRLRLEFESAIDLIVDGEVLNGHEFLFEVLPRALPIVVSSSFGQPLPA